VRIPIINAYNSFNHDLIVLTKIGDITSAIRVYKVDIPTHRIKGDKALLKCLYDLEGDRLYSVKWYKDEDEFFRVIPLGQPRHQVFNSAGINVDVRLYIQQINIFISCYTWCFWRNRDVNLFSQVDSSSETEVVLKGVNRQTSGSYKCEAIAEAPLFRTAVGIGDMMVVGM
jgi:hypothetical protein